MCETCLLQMFYTFITGVWITFVIHLKYHTCIICVSHMQYTCGTFGSVGGGSDARGNFHIV